MKITDKVSKSFDLKKTLDECVEQDDELKNRIDKIIVMKEKNMWMFSKLNEMVGDCEAYLESDERCEHKDKVAERVLGKCKSQFAELERMRITLDKIMSDEEAYVTKLLKDSGGKIDKYGVPQVISYEEWEDEFFEKDRVGWLRAEVRKLMDDDAMMKGTMRGFSDKDKEDSLDYVMEYMPYITKLIGKHQGDGYQKVINPLQALYELGRLKQYSGKKGRTYTTDRDIEMIELFMPYWEWRVNDMTMPNDHNRESLFYEIAKKYDLGFDRICQIERRLYKTHKPPKRNLTD